MKNKKVLNIAAMIITAVLLLMISLSIINTKLLNGKLSGNGAKEVGMSPEDSDTQNILVPGSGFSGSTSQPATIGSGRGANAKAIARWDTVPIQDFSGSLNVGVVAFHMSGIDHVEFSANAGPWISIKQMTLNPQTNIYEYWVTVRASDFSDGLVEIQAVAYPNVGIPRVLAGTFSSDPSSSAMVSGEFSLMLYANSNNTLNKPVRWVSTNGNDTIGTGSQTNPYKTIKKAVQDIQLVNNSVDGAIVYLQAGDYQYPEFTSSYPVTTSRWLTISGAPDTNPAQVRIISNNGTKGLGTKLVHLQNLTIYSTVIPTVVSSLQPRAWIDHITIEGLGPGDGFTPFGTTIWKGGVWATESTFHDMSRATLAYFLVRNANIYNIGTDALRDNPMVVNAVISNFVNTLDGSHRDIDQFFSPLPRTAFENIIQYNIKATQGADAQSIFAGDGTFWQNAAFVNILTYTSIAGQWANSGDHLLFWNLAIFGTPTAQTRGFSIRDIGGSNPVPTTITNLDIRNSVFEKLTLSNTGSVPNRTDQSWASNNHYIDIISYKSIVAGVNATTGGSIEILLADSINGDFRPTKNSVLVGRVQNPLVPSDINGVSYGSPASIGPLEYFGATSTPLSVCGNNLKESGEQCDDGNNNNQDSCSNQCTINVEKQKALKDFDGQTTDLEKINDLKNVSDFVIEKKVYGFIKFLQKINLLGNKKVVNLTEIAERIEKHVRINKTIVEIDSDNLPELNQPATITLYNISFDKPIIIRNGEKCLSNICQITMYNKTTGELTFIVNSFSNYTITEDVEKPVRNKLGMTIIILLIILAVITIIIIKKKSNTKSKGKKGITKRF